MNLPNKLTVFRMILVPVFVAVILSPAIPGHYLWSWLIFGGASLTDHFDGRIARRRNQITNFGKFLDPLADKILVISAFVCLMQLGFANIWCVLIVIAREFMVTFIRLIGAEEGVVIAANKWGKAKTVSQMAAVLFILAVQYAQELVAAGALRPFSVAGMESAPAFLLFGNILVWLAAALTLISGAVYLKQNIRLVNSTK